jgi:hypothetical protein
MKNRQCSRTDNVVRLQSGSTLPSFVVAAALTCVSGAAFAVSRCTDAKGKVTYQDTPCEPAASRSSKVDTSEAFTTKPGPVRSEANRPPRQEI